MSLFRKSEAADAAPGERHCRGCGGSLADDQLACLQCGAVDEPAGGRERRWLLSTGGLVGVALFLVTSASFAATTALRTGDPTAVKKEPPAAVAQAQPPAALPPASGDGTAPDTSKSPKGPDLGAAPAPVPAPGGGSGGGGKDNSSGSSGSGSSAKPAVPKPDPKPEPAPPPPPKITRWPVDQEGYTVVVYKFDTKAEAKKKAREVAGKDLQAGVLHSDDFASLDPGSWLVYIGEFESAKQAERAGAKYENAGYPGEVTFVGQTASPEYQQPPQDAGATPQQPALP
jgi:hypothetical protein